MSMSNQSRWREQFAYHLIWVINHEYNNEKIILSKSKSSEESNNKKSISRMEVRYENLRKYKTNMDTDK